MQLALAAVGPTVLDAIRERPVLIAGLLRTGNRVLADSSAADSSPADSLPADFSPADFFLADFDDLSATADGKPSRAWFDTAVNGTEPLGYDEVTDGPAFALDVDDVRAVALGLVEEGWAPSPGPSESDDTDVDATARSLGAAAGWDPDEFATYGQMLSASWSPDFVHRLVRAVGAAGNWTDDTVERVHAAVAVPAIVPRGNGLASFFATAAREGRAVVGGLVA